eukprot:6476662-Amphidinium_carterae.1
MGVNPSEDRIHDLGITRPTRYQQRCRSRFECGHSPKIDLLVSNQNICPTLMKIGNYFETGATFALFKKDLFSVRRFWWADEEAFWQWYPGCGFKVPRFNGWI